MLAQDQATEHLIELFPNLEAKWIKELVSTFPNQDIQFLSSQCIEMGNQLKLLNENKDDNKDEEKQPPLIRNISLVLPIDDDLLIEDTMTDQGPSMSLLAGLPKQLVQPFESFTETVSADFIPGLLDILCHFELMKFNVIFMQEELDESNQQKLSECLTEIKNLLTDLSNNLEKPNYRTISRSKTSFKDIQGIDTLLAYIGWNFIETNEEDDGGIYMYPNNNNEYLLCIILLFDLYIKYLNQPNKNDEKDEENKHEENKDDIKNDNIDLHVPVTHRQDSYITPQGPEDDKIHEQNRIFGLIENDMKSNEYVNYFPYKLDANRLLLAERSNHQMGVMDMSMMSMAFDHEWPASIPRYASVKESKRKNLDIYVYSWKSIDSKKWKYLAIEVEMNKFDRISLFIELANCEYSNVSSEYKLDDVQIFKNGDKINIITEIGPFGKKLVFKVKYDAYKGMTYRRSAQYLESHEEDIDWYVSKCDNIMRDITDKYLQLFQRYNLDKIIHNAEMLNDILGKKVKVNYFIDLEFPPLIKSLITKKENPVADIEKFQGLIWKRVWDFADFPKLFGPKPIEYSDVTQGSLGNCGFAASITAVSKCPELIKKLFLYPSNNKVSPIGLYEIQLCHNGIWKKYIIDDCIPCNYYRNFTFARHEDKNILWVSLLEKCAAKAYGGYDRLKSFEKLNALTDLTGCPTEQIEFKIFEENDIDKSYTKLWNTILEWSNNKCIIMTLSAHAEDALKPVTDLGLSGTIGHAFTFLRAVEVEHIRLVQIRNPWGSCSKDEIDRWKGEYSRLCMNNEWSDELIEIVQPNLDKNDGTFWMSFDDFRLYFRNASLCYLLMNDQTYVELRMSTKIKYSYNDETKHEDILYPQLMLDLTTNDEQKYDNDSMFLDLEWIGIQQENLRSQYVVHQEYLDCCLLIGKLIDDNYVEPVKITDCYKRKTQFQKVYVQLERNKKYILIPYTSGIPFHKNYKTLNNDQSRVVNISLFIKSRNNNIGNIQLLKSNVNEMVNIEQVKPILTNFALKLCTKKQDKRNGIETYKKWFGMMELFAVQNAKNDNKTVNGTFDFELKNTLPAIGFDEKFILNNEIYKQDSVEKDKNNDNEIKWDWISTIQQLQYMETHLFVFGQYKVYKSMKTSWQKQIYRG